MLFRDMYGDGYVGEDRNEKWIDGSMIVHECLRLSLMFMHCPLQSMC